MEFINHTPFPALAFEGIDQHEQGFHVVAMRQTLTWNIAGELLFADDQQPLCDEDQFFDAGTQGSVRQESDLCPYKPRCDVIVNATAYPPQRPGVEAPDRFDVRLVVTRPAVPAPMPPQSYDQNSPMPASQAATDIRQAEETVENAAHESLAQAASSTATDERLIDKTLVVRGARQFVKRTGWARLGFALLKIGTLGLVRPSSWRLTQSESAHAIQVRLEQAFGGQCRIDADSEAADKVPKAYRLNPEQTKEHPDAAHPPAVHDACAYNPAGAGYTRDWYLDAIDASSMPAPQIEYPEHPITIGDFNRVRSGGLDGGERLVAGLGVRPKGHPERAKSVGTIDDAFIQSDAPLPSDFDFAVWHAAWPDQQVDVLAGNEQIEVINLCSRETPGAKQDADGNTVLTLQLPGHLPFVLVRFQNGAIGELNARLDTLLIDPDKQEISCVWRATIGKEPLVRKLEARMLERHSGPAQAVASDMPEGQEVLHG